MCGIVGIINGNSEIKTGLSRVFTDMLFADQLRGFDGAGVFWYDDRDDKYAVRKDADFLEVYTDKGLEKALQWLEKIPFMVGHNRSATRGSVVSENNHPFDEGDVVLVHNGTMTHIPHEFNKDVNVDSHAIAKMITAGSTEAFIKDSFGAYALVWFDKNTRQLNLLRNKDRPLSLVYFKDFALIASEPQMAQWIGSRNGFAVERVESLPEHKLYQFDKFSLIPNITDLSHCAKIPVRAVYPMVLWDGEDDDDYDVTGFPHYDRVDMCTDIRTGVIRRGPWAGTKSVFQQEAEYNGKGVWDYFDNHPTRKPKEPEITTVSSYVGESQVKLAVGQRILFSLDSAKLHTRMAEITGNLPHIPISSYEVKGNMSIANLQRNEESTCYLAGIITTLKPLDSDNKFQVWVRNIEFTDVQDPQYDVEGTEEKK